MNKKIYLQPMTFSRYDEGHALVYLNEEVIENYVPEHSGETEQPVKPMRAYAYSGTMADGGTLISACDDSRDSLVNGIIRLHYSESEEAAIKTHQLVRLEDPDIDKAGAYASEWAEFKVLRQSAIDTVDRWLSE